MSHKAKLLYSEKMANYFIIPSLAFHFLVKFILKTYVTLLFLVARRATYVVDGRFFAHYFWKVEGRVRIHVNSCVAHVWLPYMVINV